MERRFVRVWESFQSRVDAGEPFEDILADSRVTSLVAALGAAGATDPVAANAIATEVLNRIHRAPYLGAAIASAATALVLALADLAFTGWPIFATATPRTFVVLVFTILATLFSAFMWLLWRGWFPHIRYLLNSSRRTY